MYEAIANEDESSNNDSPFLHHQCNYYQANEVASKVSKIQNPTSYFHLNCRGLSSNWENFQELIYEIHSNIFSLDFIGISEVFRCKHDQRLYLTNYHDMLTRTRDDEDDCRGGVALFIKNTINYKIRDDLSVFIPHVFESLFIEYESKGKKKNIVGVIYRPNTPPRADLDLFVHTLDELLHIINNEGKPCTIMGDTNINLLKFDTHDKTNTFLNNCISHGFLPRITKPTRLAEYSATLIDHIYSNDIISKSF